MQYHKLTSTRIGRKNHLAQALALALALGGGVATTAVANQADPGQAQPISAAEQQAQQALAERQALRAADTARASAQTAGTTRYVANCNDSGGGSLRDTVASANSGDTIDMSTMSCNSIHLNSRIFIMQNDITLLGKLKVTGPLGLFLVPDTFIHGSNSSSAAHVFWHNGSGTIMFKNIDLSDSSITDYTGGACIYSRGNIDLANSYVHNCTAKRSAGSTLDIKGGAIYADGEVRLHGVGSISSSRVYDSVASATDGDAYGGGIYAGQWVSLDDGSSVHDNTVETDTGKTYGGGIYGKSYVDVKEYASVEGNSAVVHDSYTQSFGTGFYTEKDSILQDAHIEDNKVIYPSGKPQYIGQGVGIYAENGVNALRVHILDNSGSVSSGGGIFTNGFLVLSTSTVANNYGTGTGAIFAKGNAIIQNSTISGNRSRGTANIKLGPDATSNIFIGSSTISGNTITASSTNGAALNLQHDATIKNSTITGNIEKNTSDTKYGAGISLDNNVNVDLTSTIVGGNFIDKSQGGKVASDIEEAKGASGATISGDHNLIVLSSLPLPSDTLQLQSPQLGPLLDNGGLTKTHEPCRNSPTFENGYADSGVLYDQRGAGFPRLVGGSVDIGAVEAPDYRNIIFRNGFEDGACGT